MYQVLNWIFREPKKTQIWTLLKILRASLVAELVKSLPAMQETWVRSLDWEDPLEKGKATDSSILACRWSCKELDMTGHFH